MNTTMKVGLLAGMMLAVLAMAPTATAVSPQSVVVCVTDWHATPYSGSCGSNEDSWVTVYISMLQTCITSNLSHLGSGC